MVKKKHTKIIQKNKYDEAENPNTQFYYLTNVTKYLVSDKWQFCFISI